MKGPLRLAYDAVAHVARAATAVIPPSDTKLLRALADRRGVVARYKEWSRTQRDDARRLLWMHAPSVGEGLMAKPILQRVRSDRPDLQTVYTYFSPSAVSFSEGIDVDFRDYLPLDTAGDSAAALDALRPAALVFSKLDVWPNLVDAARHRGVRTGLVSASLSSASSRRSPVARALLRDAYATLDAVGAVDTADADRLIELGVRPSAIEVTGDTRYDQVWDRTTRASMNRELAPLRSNIPTIVAGSTWPADEAVLLPAIAQVKKSMPELRMIIAPHEPTPGHIAPILAWGKTAGFDARVLSDPDSAAADVVVVDRVGILGDLYALSDVAFVGGGFRDAGLHSVLEPAAFATPVLFGPRYRGSRDAILLLQASGAISVRDERDLVSSIVRWLRNPETRAEAGAAAKSVVESGLGAADRSYQLVMRLID